MVDRRILTVDLRLALRAVVDLALPRVCVVCGRPLLLYEEHLCTCCRADLPLTWFWDLRHNPMSESFNERIQELIDRYEPFSCAAALFYYSGSYRNITRALKYHRNFAIGKNFACLLGRRLASLQIDLVVPVPLHWLRKLRRGYNQADFIARCVAAELAVPACCRLLVRRRFTRSQTRLDPEQRRSNVASAFAVRLRALARLRKRFSLRHILLVDDVYTTGATLLACHRALRAALGPEVHISVATLAYVGR